MATSCQGCYCTPAGIAGCSAYRVTCPPGEAVRTRAPVDPVAGLPFLPFEKGTAMAPVVIGAGDIRDEIGQAAAARSAAPREAGP
jgi:hypothetical protein